MAIRWQLPDSENSVLASTANDLRHDKYTPMNPEKLKAAAAGLSQSKLWFSKTYSPFVDTHWLFLFCLFYAS